MKTRHIVEIAAIALICWSMVSCTVTTPQGSATVDSGAAIAVTEIIGAMVDSHSGK